MYLKIFLGRFGPSGPIGREETFEFLEKQFCTEICACATSFDTLISRLF